VHAADLHFSTAFPVSLGEMRFVSKNTMNANILSVDLTNKSVFQALKHVNIVVVPLSPNCIARAFRIISIETFFALPEDRNMLPGLVLVFAW
jgi:hypothetical protein